MAYYNMCNRCQLQFWGRKQNKCRQCQKYRQCLNCERETDQIRCQLCEHNPPKYACCQDSLSQKPRWLCGKMYCDQCITLIQTKLGQSKWITGKKVKVEYERKYVDHDGYCSDPGEYLETVDKMIKYYPLTENETPQTIYRTFELPNGGCRNGSGYCGEGGVYYQITSANIVDDENISQ